MCGTLPGTVSGTGREFFWKPCGSRLGAVWKLSGRWLEPYRESCLESYLEASGNLLPETLPETRLEPAGEPSLEPSLEPVWSPVWLHVWYPFGAVWNPPDNIEEHVMTYDI